MRDHELDPGLAEAARTYNEPPPTPREKMWAAIDDHRRSRRKIVMLPIWQSRWVLWPAAAVAALILGIAIGRIFLAPVSSNSGRGDLRPQAIARAEPEQPAARGRLLFELAAVPLMSQAEVLLTQFRTGAPEGNDGGSFSDRAAGLLAETRMLLQSPAAQNAELRQLLDDLELVLAQIVQIAARQQTEDRQWIEENLKQRSLLSRLRTKIPAGVPTTNL